MTFFTVYSLLLLFSVAPLLHGLAHNWSGIVDSLCSEGYYCPAGADCINNGSLCVKGACEATTQQACLEDISVGFVASTFDVSESNGLAQPVVELDGPIECCSVSVTVKVEDITAKGDEDYEVPPDQYIKVKFPAGKTRVSFDIIINDDNKMEGSETFRITIFDLSVPYGITLGSITSATITILDDDSTTLSFSQSKFYVDEYEGQALPELALSVPATFDFTVYVDSSNVDLSRECDNFQSGPFEVLFPNGTSAVKFPINITDDDVYEGDESFSLAIDRNLPDLVVLGTPYRATVVVRDDEKIIIANFEKSSYRVHEHDGSIAPKLNLTEPSPCCFMVHARLENKTAHGKAIDFGYASPKIYNYTFNAGSTCAYPDANITIADDMIRENDEAFQIVIIDAALPFNVKAGHPATIIINDNDNAVSFKHDHHDVREDEAETHLELMLYEPATSDRVIQVYSYHSDDNATGNVDYRSGPYNVSLKRGQTSSFFPISMIDDNLYEGDEYFTVFIDDLPHGIVLAEPSEIKVKIIDNEYKVCFGKQGYSVDEGDKIQIDLILSRTLPYPLTVQLDYTDMETKINTDYRSPPKSVRFNVGQTVVSYTISTNEDSKLETKERSFIISAKYPSQPNNTDDCDITTVTIIDDDDCKIRCERSEYNVKENSQGTARLVLCDKPTFSFSVNIKQEDNTTIGDLDYKIQDYRNTAKFERDGSKYIDLKIEPKDDELVEDDEVYYLEIEPITLPDRIVPGDPSKCKVIIQNDDTSTVTREGSIVKFSKEVDFLVEVTATYKSGNPETLRLLPGDTQVILDSSRVNSLQRITITPDCHLDRNDFKIGTNSIYLTSLPYPCF